MALFQTQVERQFLVGITTDLTPIYKKHLNYFGNPAIQANILELNEQQYQGEFIEALFVNILGYTAQPQPNFNLLREKKNETDAKSADAAISINNQIVAVIELKDHKTQDLKKVEVQAFGYKNNHKNCHYVVTSNFERLRFYIDNAVDFIEFDLFNLSLDEFRRLWLCLSYESIAKNLPQEIKSQSISNEDIITKQLYKDYSVFKRLLFDSIVALNPDYDKLLLFKKTQKLLDRFLFLLFAEDKELLPANSVKGTVEKWKKFNADPMNDYQSLYSRFVKYFKLLDEGYKDANIEIYAYNGGLFANDELLNQIKVDDAILSENVLKLASYDYGTDVDVNILGHIFENSLNEIEQVANEITTGEKTTSKRKQDGVFYTPRYITQYIVENTVGRLCEEKKAELGINEELFDFISATKKEQELKRKKAVKVFDDYREWLLHISIVDPACGSGAFLNMALDFLMAEHNWIDRQQEKIAGLKGHYSMELSNIENTILENNLFGVDINDESVEIAKLSLWLRTAKPHRKLNSLNNNIKCGNSLIDDPAVAGEKAFDWHKEFPQIFAKGGFDVVIGNPPYVRAELLSDCIDYYQSKYKAFQPAADLFTYFYEFGFSILKSNGLFGFISNTFDKTKAAIVLREWLKCNTSIHKYIDFTDVQIFEGATTYPIILIAKNNIGRNNKFKYIKILKGNEQAIDFYTPTLVEQEKLEKENWTFKDNKSNDLIKKICKYSPITVKYRKCYYGVKTALNEAFIIPKDLFSSNEFIKPIYEGRELSKWTNTDYNQSLILFKSKSTKKTYGDLNESTALDKLIEFQSPIINHLLQFEEKAKARYDKGEYWWELRNCAYYHLFEQPKIIFPNLQNKNKFSIDEMGVYINAPAVMLSLAHLKNPIPDGKFLLGILNSKLIWYFLKSICVVRSGGYIEVKPQYFEQIPIPEIAFEEQQSFISKVDSILTYNNDFQLQIGNFQRMLCRKFELEELPGKLQNWYLLTYKDFITELGKKKVKLTLAQEAEWEEYFHAEQAKALEIKKQIDDTDKEIDRLVYALYELTEEEVKIVEGE